MSIKSLMNYTFVSKYARWDSDKKKGKLGTKRLIG